MNAKTKKLKKTGYSALIELHGLKVAPHHVRSFIAKKGERTTIHHPAYTEEIYPSRYDPGDMSFDHLEFAMRYEGVNPGIICAFFKKIQVHELREWIAGSINGIYKRKAWFLYEYVTGTQLDLPSLKSGNYVDMLDEKDYFVSRPRKAARQRINDNLLGVPAFCPLIRRTGELGVLAVNEHYLENEVKTVLDSFSTDIITRAAAYLYSRETKSTFEIENERPAAGRAEKFIAALKKAGTRDFCNEHDLTALQNEIVDQRFRDTGLRDIQNYVGESAGFSREIIHYIAPKPADLPALFNGYVASHARVRDSVLHPIIKAAVASFSFVYLHPFNDGNGRIHRFLIHNVLTLAGFTPPQVVFPVSAAILRDRPRYNSALESFSRPLLELVDGYTIDKEGSMTVHNDTMDHYRFIDLTAQAEYLLSIIKNTIEHEFKNELDYLIRYDKSKKAIQEIVDLPDRLIDLVIKFFIQNNRKISREKRKKFLGELSDDEVKLIEESLTNIWHVLPENMD